MGEEIDGRADQYALAATAYHLLTGSQLFPHSNPAVVISHHLNLPPPTLADTRAELAALDPVLAVALAKDPDDRFARCAEFATAMAAQSSGRGSSWPVAATKPARVLPTPKGSHAEPAAEPEQTPSSASRPRRGWLALAGGLAVILLAGAIALAWHPWKKGQSTAMTTTSSSPSPTASSNSSSVPPPTTTPPPVVPAPAPTVTVTQTAPPPPPTSPAQSRGDEAGFVWVLRDSGIPDAVIPGGPRATDAQRVASGYQACEVMDRYPDNIRRAAFVFYDEQGSNVPVLINEYAQYCWNYMSYAATYLCPWHAWEK